jgi:hypothetical protein
MSKPMSYFSTLLNRKAQNIVRAFAPAGQPAAARRAASAVDVPRPVPASQMEQTPRPAPIFRRGDPQILPVPTINQVSLAEHSAARPISPADGRPPGKVEGMRPGKGEGWPPGKADSVRSSVEIPNAAVIMQRLEVAPAKPAMERAPTLEPSPQPMAVEPVISLLPQVPIAEPQSQERAAIFDIRKETGPASRCELRIETAIAWPAQLDAVQRTAVRTAVERQARARVSAIPAGKSAGVQRIEVRVEQVNIRFDSPVPSRAEAAKPASRNTFGEFFQTRSLR